MKIGLCAFGEIGLEIARAFSETGEPPACLVLDERDQSGLNARIAVESRCVPGHIFEYGRLRKEDGPALLAPLNLDLMVLAWWPYIIKAPLLDVPRLGWLNFHPSLLPHNRGKHPNFWALVEGRPFGVTLHFADAGVDSGAIAYQSAIETGWTDTGATLYAKARREIVRLFREKLTEIRAGRIPRMEQDMSAGSCHRATELEQASRIDLDRTYTGRQLLNVLRARTFPPHPAAWFEDNGRRYEVRVTIAAVDPEDKNA